MLEIFYLTPYQKLVVGVAVGLSFYAWLLWPWYNREGYYEEKEKLAFARFQKFNITF